MAESDLLALLTYFGYPPTGEVSVLLLNYLRILKKWNKRIRLVGSTDWETLGPLFHEAIWAASKYPEGPVSYLEIGPGGGFPSIPLRILRPEMDMDLVEANSRRAAFLEHVAQELDLRSLRIHNHRLDGLVNRRGVIRSWKVVSWKGLRLDRRDIELLRSAGSEGLEFWLFHGKDLPVRDREHFLSCTTLLASYTVPGRSHTRLSVYGLKTQSGEGIRR